MRWTEIEAHATENGLPLPTYRLMDRWTRDGLLMAEFKGDQRGRYRWWPPAEVAVALTVARLTAVGLTVDLAFTLARTLPDADGTLRVVDDSTTPPTTVTVVWA